MRFVAPKTEHKREGRTITRKRASNGGEPGGGSAGAIELQLGLLDVHPLLAGESLLMVRPTPQGWKAFTRTEALAALRLMTASSGRDPAQYALHSGRIGGRRSWPRKGCPSCKSSGPVDRNRVHSCPTCARLGKGKNPSLSALAQPG